ncbi:MAG: DUF4139 domain-containing protein [Armatimonadetes bacterium]|nr:DUF4139 domain-containing protein [Armatimonadota bacterium]
MRSKRWILGAALAALAVVGGACSLRARASTGAGPQGQAGARSVELTVYANDFALVYEKRPVELEPGANRLAFADVSKDLDPNSVLLRCAGPGPQAPEIVGHSYDLGVRDSQNLLRQEVGKRVEVVRYSDTGREASREAGRLLAAEGGSAAVVEIGGKLYVQPQGTIVVDGADGVGTIPQLIIQVESPVKAPSVMDVAYLTRGLSWNADYVATLAPAADTLDLECYATVTNRTGVPYPDASVTLVAGSPNRAARVVAGRLPGSRDEYFGFDRNGVMPLPAASESLNGRYPYASAPEAVGELYTYALKRPSTIRSEELNRLLLLRRPAVKIHKDYSYRAPWIAPWTSPQEERGAVAVGISFQNTPGEGTGDPLPRGALRVYDADRSGRLRYAGAADVPATPKDQKVSVTLANAFDLTAQYRTLSSKRLWKRRVQKQVRVVLRNERAHAADVRVVQGFSGSWSITKSSDPRVKLNSSTAQWTVPVPAGGEKAVTFVVEMTG